MIKLSDKYTANNQKRIGTFTVTRKWQKVEPELMIIAEKFDPKGNVYELKKAVSDKVLAAKNDGFPVPDEFKIDTEGIKEAIQDNENNIQEVVKVVEKAVESEAKKPKKSKSKKRK